MSAMTGANTVSEDLWCANLRKHGLANSILGAGEVTTDLPNRTAPDAAFRALIRIERRWAGLDGCAGDLG